MIINKEQLKEFFILFTYSNLKYEKDYEEVELNQVESIFGNAEITLDTTENIVTAIKNHKTLYNQFQNICNKYDGKLSIKLIKEVHAILMKNLYRKELKDVGEKPGEFKKRNYVVGLFDVGVKAGEVEERLQELFDEVNAVNVMEENVYKVVAYLHNWLCAIHPFADGNGMVVRFMINYLLLVNGFRASVFGVERKEVCRYISILEKFDDTQEICEMENFIESYN